MNDTNINTNTNTINQNMYEQRYDFERFYQIGVDGRNDILHQINEEIPANENIRVLREVILEEGQLIIEEQETQEIVRINLDRAVNRHTWIDHVDRIMSYLEGLTIGQRIILGVTVVGMSFAGYMMIKKTKIGEKAIDKTVETTNKTLIEKILEHFNFIKK